MTNDGNDFDPELGIHEEHETGVGSAATKPGIRGNLASAWSRPFFKLMVLMLGVGAVVAAGVSFLGGGSKSDNDITHLARPPQLNEAPGGPSSAYVRDQTELANKQRSEEAIANGGSALPTPVGQTSDIGALTGADKKNDPLNELRAETENLKQQIQQQQVQQQKIQQSAQNQQPQQFDNVLSEAMQRQMQTLLESWAPRGAKIVQASKLEHSDTAGQTPVSSEASGANAANGASGSLLGNTKPAKTIVAAGTVSYGQLLTEANSDVPGPILAQIVSGPLAGARAVGEFTTTYAYEEYNVMHFTIANFKGKDYQINAVALDPNTTLGGMATEVDERYFTRVVLPAAAGFMQGFGEALGSGNSTIQTNGTSTLSTQSRQGFHQGLFQGLGQAGQTAGQFFQNRANQTKPLVKVAAGTPVGIFFVTTVTDRTDSSAAQGYANAGNQGYGGIPINAQGQYGGYGGGNGGVYPGANVGGFGGGGYGSSYGGSSNGGGAPYPNYAVPGYGYGNNPGPSSGNRYSTSAPIISGYGQ